MEWRHKDRLRVKIKASASDSGISQEVILALKARDEGVTKCNEPYLHLFYYQFERPTDKQVCNQVLKLKQSILE